MPGVVSQINNVPDPETGSTLVNVNAPVVATTSWWLHFTAPVVALKVKKSIPVDFIIYL